jgi:predicted DNA-binding protein with PD1-like motif
VIVKTSAPGWAQLAAVPDPSRIHLVRLNPHEDLLQGLRAAVAEAAIENGAILSGAGSLSRYNVHVVKTTNLPPGNVFFSGEGAYDILTLTGAIIDGRVHAHVTFSDPEKAMGGHLEEGCEVLTFAIVAIVETPGVDLREWDTIRQF